MRLLLVNLSLLACLLGLSIVVVPVSAAPVPKDGPKTTAEKLVGIWKQVEMNGHPVAPEREVLFEYTKDGKMAIRWNFDRKTGRKGKHEETGAYKVVGNRLYMYIETRLDPKERRWHIIITEITAHKFTCLGPDSPATEENVFERIEAR